MHISLAAGCSPDDMVDSMSNAYCASLTQRRRAMEQKQQKLDGGLQQQLAALQHLLPNGQIPAQTFDGRCITGAQLSLSSVRAEHDPLILTLKHSLGVKLSISLDDLKDWRSSHPHWRHRIARVEQLLADMPLQAQDVRPAD